VDELVDELAVALVSPVAWFTCHVDPPFSCVL